MHTKIQDSFEYLAEQAKLNFQANISSLLELQLHLESKRIKAMEYKKEGAYLTNKELKQITDWILQVSTNILGDYEGINRTNRLLNVNYKVVQGLLQNKTPNLKSLVE